nr:hypothetical protein [Methanobacterium formicicum]
MASYWDLQNWQSSLQQVMTGLKFVKKPKIAVIITGSELVMPKRDIEGPEVINSNHFTIKSMVESCLSTPDMFHSIDNAQQVEQLFKKTSKRV